MYPSDVKAARDRRVRAIRKALHEHVITKSGAMCTCGVHRPEHRTAEAWWVEHIADVLAGTW